MTAQVQKRTAQLNKTTNETNAKSCLDRSLASEKPAAVTAQATLAFQIAYTALWNTQEFSATEITQATKLIDEILAQHDNPAKAFNNFVQRVLLARQYINTHPGSYAPIPTEWLSTTNKNGFAGTQRWLDAVDNLRSSIPTYKQALKAFAEAVQETATSRKAVDFHYWRSYFIQQNAQGLLNLFLSTMANVSNWEEVSG